MEHYIQTCGYAMAPWVIHDDVTEDMADRWRRGWGGENNSKNKKACEKNISFCLHKTRERKLCHVYLAGGALYVDAGCKHKPRKGSHFPAPPDVQLIWCLRPRERKEAKKRAETRLLTRFHTRRFKFGGAGDHLGPTGEDLTAKG